MIPLFFQDSHYMHSQPAIKRLRVAGAVYESNQPSEPGSHTRNLDPGKVLKKKLPPLLWFLRVKDPNHRIAP
jgi:hypothetical protein